MHVRGHHRRIGHPLHRLGAAARQLRHRCDASPPLPPVGPLCPDRLSTATAGPTFYKTANVRMSFDAAKEAALRSIFPQHDIQLSCVVEDVFVVGLGRKCGI